MIQVRNISLSLGTQILFDGISLCIDEGQRIGILGRNGAGKSTFLKTLAGLIPVDEGTISIQKHKKIAYMPQEVTLLSDKVVFDEAFSVFSYFLSLEQRKKELESVLESGQAHHHAEKLIEEYLEVQQKLKTFDRSAAQAKTERILKGLGFTEKMNNQPVALLSVGWKMRLILAQLLLQDADFYLFDEPTNHLDIVTKRWFFEFLKNGRFGFLLVTHDRYYLDYACDALLELERGKGILFKGNFTHYVVYKEQQRQVLQAAYEKQQRDLTRKQETIERFRASATKAKMAQSMIKQLEKVELIEVEPPLPTIKLSFPPAARSGVIALKVENVKHVFDETILFEQASCEIQRGEKVALIAPNGTGKTTLFNLITGKYSLQKGSISLGHNVHYAVFEQDQMRALTPANTVYEEILSACPAITESIIRSFLGSFLFSGDTIHKKINVLSGGERNRVAMVKVLLQKANLLLLDEPTNHLDLYAKEVLLQALQKYDGTIFLVCHDHDFLNKIATRIIELTPQGLYSYPGNYDSYLTQKQYQEQPQRDIQEKKAERQVISTKEHYASRKEITSLETKIERLEKEVKKINELFWTYAYGTTEYYEASKKLEQTQKILEETMSMWERLQENL